MKKIYVLTLLFSTMISAQTQSKKAFLEKWENSKTYLLGIAEVMPESKYSFKPTERQMSFAEQLDHIRGNMEWLSNSYFSNVDFDRTKTEKAPKSKEELLVFIEEHFNKVSKLIEATPEAELSKMVDFFAGPKSKLQILNLLQDHVTHHRGQLIVYLNLNNIKPPGYSGW